MTNKSPRTAEIRAKNQRYQPWKPPSTLDAPDPPEGFSHRWIRESVMNYDDGKNVSARLREGFELVRADEYPEFEAPIVESGKFEGVFGVGGLVLARIPLETVAERTEYFAQRSADQIEAVEQDMLRENAHPTMAIVKAERQSRVTFGGSRKN